VFGNELKKNNYGDGNCSGTGRRRNINGVGTSSGTQQDER
jgi:hypothetical protein